VSLSARLKSMKPRESGLPCGVSMAIKEMDAEDAKTLEEVMFSVPRILSNSQLQEALVAEGYDVSSNSVSLHRRKQCRCFVGRATRISETK
jgi:hypothetical protein